MGRMLSRISHPARHRVPGEERVTAEAQTAQATIEVLGMTCTGCARTLENAFRRFPDIECTVDFPARTVTVRYAPAAYQREVFEQAIEAHGYRVKGSDH
jgi:copper chaperone CopZ